MRQRDPAKAVEVLDLLLQFFADGALWLQHDFDHPDGSRCLVSALTPVRRKHGISGDGTGYYLLEFTLRAAGEVRAPQFGSAEGDLDPEMVAIAGAIIRQRTGNFDPSTYHDRYQEALQQLIEAKIERGDHRAAGAFNTIAGNRFNGRPET